MGKSWNEVVLRNLDSLRRLVSKAKQGKKITPIEVEEIHKNLENAIKYHRDDLDLKIQMAAHDIFNVLAVGRGYLDLYLAGEDSVKDTMDTVKEAIDDVYQELNNDYYPEETNIHNILEEEINRAKMKHKGIRINSELEPVVAKVDKYLLKAAVRNLINNSVQNMRENDTIMKVINIKLKDRGDHFEIIHEDTGTGIRKDFDPFGGKTGKPGRGTGTGGAVIKKIAELHGGNIFHENKSEGGSRFRIIIPKFKRRHPK